MNKKIPKNIIEKIHRLHENGLTTREISTIVGVGKSSVQYHVSEKTRKNALSQGKRLKGQRLTQEERDKIIAMLMAGHSNSEVRREFGLCHSTVQKFRNPENHKAYLEKRKNYIKNRDISGHFKSIRGNKCEICGYDKSPKCLDFHHIDPTKKKFQISQSYLRPMPVIEEEVAKCILVCKNCHAEIHHGITEIPIDQTAYSH
jgi:transposase